MASIDRSDPVILGHVLAEHQDLFNRLTAARKAFAAEAPPAATHLAALQTCLTSLRDHLDEHFTQEERGGFLEEAVARMPRLGSAVAGLMTEHPALLAELDKLIAALPSSVTSAAAWQQAGQSFAGFTAHMMAHERSENAVVQEGYNEDLGLVD
jgi:iron-sulfur cluster repair protein YtfE (RIC family)